MKILFVAPSLAVGGMERVLVSYANALAKRGHDVTVKIFDPEKDLAGELRPSVHFAYIPPKYRLLQKIPKIKYRFDAGKWETRASAKQLHDYYVGREKFDVEIGFFRGRSIKIVSGSQNPDSVKLAWVHTDFRAKIGCIYANFQSLEDAKQGYAKFHRILCVSKEAKDGFEQVVGLAHKTETLYNLSPGEEIRKKADLAPAVSVPKHRFNLCLVGRLDDSTKGQCRLISAVCQLQKEGIDAGLTLVGGGTDEQKIRDFTASVNASSFVTMTGSQSNPYPYIKQSDLLVCASYFEGYNLTVAEALILGVPVLSTRCTGPSEILDGGKYGMLVENDDTSLLNGLRTLLTTPELLERYRKAAAERAPFFDEDRILSKLESFMKKEPKGE